MVSTPIRRRSRQGQVRICDALKSDVHELIVWSYGGLSKNRRAETVPKAVVFFRRIEKDGSVGIKERRDVALNYLGLLSIGSIWHQGVCKAEAIRETQYFDVDFTAGAWSFVSPADCAAKKIAQPISRADYPLYFANDKNWWLNFPLNGGKNLLIPCIEFLVRCYGRSEEVSRILVTYPWHKVEEHFYAPFDQPAQPDAWPVKLKKRLRNGDTVFLAHAKYDRYTQLASKEIYSQIEAAFTNEDDYAFIKVAPWFQGAAKIKVSGQWINNGNTFLGLRIFGCSEPIGETILRSRENANTAVMPAEGGGHGTAWAGSPERVLKNYPNIVDLTDSNEPDQDSSTIELEEDEFEEIGERRVVIDVRREQANTSAGPRRSAENPEAFSPGERHGRGKNVGYASIHAPSVLESHGALRDMWNAMRYMKKEYPDLIRSVEWFTFSKGFQSEGEPELVSLKPFDDDAEEISPETKRWLYRSVRDKFPRGILVTRIVVKGKSVHIVEIERRTKQSEDNGVLKESEEMRCPRI